MYIRLAQSSELKGKAALLCWSLFFFSSRRRHTRLQGDWSSDVCSSDLEHTLGLALARRGQRVRLVSCQRAPIECGFYNHRYGARRPCTVCTIASRTLADAVQLPSLALSDEVGRAIRADAERLTRSLMLAACRDFAWEGLPLGRLVEPSVLWFFNRGS